MSPSCPIRLGSTSPAPVMRHAKAEPFAPRTTRAGSPTGPRCARRGAWLAARGWSRPCARVVGACAPRTPGRVSRASPGPARAGGRRRRLHRRPDEALDVLRATPRTPTWCCSSATTRPRPSWPTCSTTARASPTRSGDAPGFPPRRGGPRGHVPWADLDAGRPAGRLLRGQCADGRRRASPASRARSPRRSRSSP